MNSRPERDRDLWAEFAAAARGRVRRRQAAMIAGYGLTGDVRFEWSAEDAEIVWSRRRRPFLHGRITVLGSVDHARGAWLWSWADDALPELARGDITEVRDFGREHGFPLLVSPSFEAAPEPVAQAGIVAADVLTAEGLWLDRGARVDVHLALHDLRRT